MPFLDPAKYSVRVRVRFTIPHTNNIRTHIGLITSLAKEVMFLVALVCLSVCGHHYSKSSEWIGLKFYGGVLGNTMKN